MSEDEHGTTIQKAALWTAGAFAASGVLAFSGAAIWGLYTFAQDGLTPGELAHIGTVAIFVSMLLFLIFGMGSGSDSKTIYQLVKEDIRND